MRRIGRSRRAGSCLPCSVIVPLHEKKSAIKKNEKGGYAQAGPLYMVHQLLVVVLATRCPIRVVCASCQRLGFESIEVGCRARLYVTWSGARRKRCDRECVDEV